MSNFAIALAGRKYSIDAPVGDFVYSNDRMQRNIGSSDAVKFCFKLFLGRVNEDRRFLTKQQFADFHKPQ